MKKEYVHYTNFGASMAPPCADNEGFLKFRSGFEALDPEEWTPSEEWIDSMNRHIDEWRETQ